MQVPGCEDILPEALSFCVQFLRQHGFSDAEGALMTELEERILLSSQPQPASDEEASDAANFADDESAGGAEGQADERLGPQMSNKPVGAEWDRSSADGSVPIAETKGAATEDAESSNSDSGSNASASVPHTEDDGDREQAGSDTYPSASDRGQAFSKEQTPPDGDAESDEYEDEDDPGYMRLEITNATSFFSREMMTSPDDAFRFVNDSRGSPSPASTPGRNSGSPAGGAGSGSGPAAAPPGVSQALFDARFRGLALEEAAGAAGPEVLEEACVVDSPTNTKAHGAAAGAGAEAAAAEGDVDAEGEGEGEDSVAQELGSGGKPRAQPHATRPLAHETSLGGWNSLGDMLAADGGGPVALSPPEGAAPLGEPKDPATPEPHRPRPEGLDAHAGGLGGPGGLGFTFSAPETASPPMLAAFGWSPTAKEADAAGAARLDAGTPPLTEGSGARSGGHLTDPDSEGAGGQELGGSGKTTPCSSPRPPLESGGEQASAGKAPASPRDGGSEAPAGAAEDPVAAAANAAAAAAAAAAVKAMSAGADGGPVVLVAPPVSVVREGTDAVVTPRGSQNGSSPTAKGAANAAWDDDVEHFEQAYEVFDLRVVHRRNRTGFEEEKDFPIRLNSIVAGRYQVMEYLGSAAFSKAVQALDLQTGMLVCMKIIKNSKDFFDQSLDEIKLLKFLNRHDPRDDHGILRLFDYFYCKEHLFIVCELLRANLYEFQRYNRDSGDSPYFALPRLQSIARQVLRSLAFMHSLGLLHCDLKPENILIQSYSRCLVKVIDVGSSCFITDHLSSYVQSRSYRAPEVILGHPYDQRIDIWSLGCIMAELWTGNVLFQNDSLVTLLARVVGILGPFPNRMLANSRHVGKYFTKTGEIYERDEETGRAYILRPKLCLLKHRLSGSDDGFADFVAHLLTVDPLKRPSAEQALTHPWLSHVYEEAV